jgi:AraC-like DNA-binding protein
MLFQPQFLSDRPDIVILDGMGDLLDRTLADLGMSGVFYAVSELGAPWGIAMPPLPGTMVFHLVTRGQAVVTVGNEQATVRPGSVLLVPHGEGHAIADADGSPLTPLFELPRTESGDRYERIVLPGAGPGTELVCGAVSFSGLAASRLVRSLPPLVEVDDGLDSAWLAAAFSLIASETKSGRPGADAVTARIADVLVIQAVRAWVQHSPDRGWVAAVRDPRIGAALDAIHADPAAPWTLATLAERATLSRSAFAAAFAELVGEPPLAYVTAWRMDLAARLVRETDLSLARVAERVGYRSEASFNRAFRRAHGMTPGAYARRGPAFTDRVDLAELAG